ncbi:hypothetical protein HO345_07620 [Treponema denticola]|nr:hypothetical protein [Treponema denticola]UTD12858.1 hypothetical protein HO345_07620 [Treponema denticola]
MSIIINKFSQKRCINFQNVNYYNLVRPAAVNIKKLGCEYLSCGKAGWTA